MTLAPGRIFGIAALAGLQLRGTGDKRTLRCPLHDDRHASAFVSASNVFFCAACTPDGGWTAKRFAEAVGVPWVTTRAYAPVPVRVEQPEPSFLAATAAEVWAASYARARDDNFAERDLGVYGYLAGRGLLEAWELGAFGVLPTSGLPDPIAWWPASGYRVIAPLLDVTTGAVVSIQARAVVPKDVKVLAPKGGRLRGSAFADARGRRVLAGERVARVVLGEGLTDSLALAVASPWPVLAAPGTSNAVAVVGDWARDVAVVLALDRDPAGEAATVEVARALYERGARRVLQARRWPAGAKDAAEVVAERGAAGLHAFLVRSSRETS